MTTTALGDLSQQFKFARNTTAIKSQLASLTESLSTGKVDDLTAVLRGDTALYSGIRHDLSRLDAFDQVAREAQVLMTNKQTTLDQVDNLRGALSERLLLVSAATAGIQLDDAASFARDSFTAIVDRMNIRLGDRSLFAGAAVDATPLAAAQDQLAAIAATIPPGATADDVIQAVDNWFADPVAGFAATGYLGDQGADTMMQVSEVRSVATGPRADDPEIVNLLRSVAIGAMADVVPGLTRDDRVVLLETSAQESYAAGDGLTSVRAALGFNEQIVAETLSEHQAKRTTLGILQNQLDQADPFETATELQAIQLRLETHFATMARVSQLSLLRFI